MVPSPPVIYNGGKNRAEQSRREATENRSYELFEVDGHCVYYGTYRCTKVVNLDWGTLKSLGQEVSARFRHSYRPCPSNGTASLWTPF